jgi:Uma2 family endonuclease
MVTVSSFPLTNLALRDLVDAEGFYRFPASLTDYWELLEQADYRADYTDHQVIATMSYESDLHSRIATRFTILLDRVFGDDPAFLIYNSNRPVYIEHCSGTGTGVFNADGMVVQSPREPYQYSTGLTAETNPILLIEILSPSTQAYDWGTKLPCYREIPSVQTILFVEQANPSLTVMERQAPNQWIDTKFTKANDTFLLNGMAFTLRQLYQGIHF